MSEVESEEGDLAVFADTCDKGIEMFLLVAEYARVVDVYEDVGGLGRGDAIEEAVTER